MFVIQFDNFLFYNQEFRLSTVKKALLYVHKERALPDSILRVFVSLLVV